jgi:hypothetical protein
MDEKSVTLHAEVRKAFPMQPGRAVRRDHEYQLCGTPNVFCGVEGKAGVYFTKVTANRCSPTFAEFPRHIVGGLDLSAHPAGIPIEQRARKYARREVAEAALRAAERHRDVNPL